MARHLVRLATVAGLTTVLALGASPAPAKAAAGGPTGVKTVITLIKSGHRVVVSGRAPAGASVYTQDRFNRHQRWAVQGSTFASSAGTFSLSFKTGERTNASYRTCVRVPGPDRCTHAKRAKIKKRSGRIVVTTKPAELKPGDYTTHVVGHVSRWLVGRAVVFQYQDAAGTWRDTDQGQPADPTEPTPAFEFGAKPLEHPGATVPVRVVVPGNDEVEAVASESWTVASFRLRPFSTLHVVAGSLLHEPKLLLNAYLFYSDAVAPAGTDATNSVTLGLQACRSVKGAVDTDQNHAPSDPFTASLTADGAAVWSDTGTSDSPAYFNVDVTGRSQLTLTTSYDAAHPEDRPWFVGADVSHQGETMPGAWALCAS
jgi:hypothetical protein